MNPIVVTGIGIVSAAGRGLAATVNALREGSSGLGSLERFHSPRCGHFPVAEVRDVDDEPRTLALARIALQDALDRSGLDASKIGDSGLILGSCVGGMPETEDAVADAFGGGTIDEAVWGQHECGYTASRLATEHELQGPVATVSTACSSSAQAIAMAADHLKRPNGPRAMIAGGADALCRLTLNGFASLLNVSPEGCRPFDAERDGMSLGEGAAFLVLEPAQLARARNAEVLAVLSGYGNTCDAHHPVAPHPDGTGAEKAMAGALRMAGLFPKEVDYINAHGTGTEENDRAEGRAIRRLFGPFQPRISSTKRLFGHTLGAAGAIEAVASILAMREDFTPGTAGLANMDPECEVDLLTDTVPVAPKTVLSNSFGFGGNNSSLCFQSAEVVA